MKTMHKMALIAAIAFGTASTIQAQPAAGEWEITLGGGGIADRDFNNGGFNVDGSLGYFFTDNWELSLRQDMGYTNPNVGGTLWSGSSRIAGDYNFILGKFVPYIGGNIGLSYGTHRSTVGEAGPEAGIKYYILDKTFAFAQGEYQFFFDRANHFGDQARHGQWVFSIGLGLNL